MSNNENLIPVNIQDIASQLFNDSNNYITKDNFAAQLERIKIFCDLSLKKYNAKNIKSKKRVNG